VPVGFGGQYLSDRSLAVAEPIVEVDTFEVRPGVMHDEPARLLFGDKPFAVKFERVDVGPGLAGKLIPQGTVL
jgi:hypothetical protein